MTIEFDADQLALADVLRDLIASAAPIERVREVAESGSGFDPELWRRLSSDIGVTGLAIPENMGGSGGSFADKAVVIEVLGASLAASAYLSSAVLGTHALLSSDDDDACEKFLPALAAGESVACLAYMEDTASWEIDASLCETTATGTTGDVTVTGTKSFVLGGFRADLILVVANTDEGPTLFAVQGDEGVRREAMTTLDPTLPMARLTFDRAPARMVGAPGAARRILDPVFDLARVAFCMDAVGGMQHCLDSSVEYANTREQFGMKIGAFQAIKHRCVDMLIQLETARSAAYHATWAAVHNPKELPVAAAMAKARCSDAYRFVASENIQVHGGIGFTWEHDAHLYFRRAQSFAELFGSPAQHRALLADRLEL